MFERVINRCWRWFKWSLLLAVAAGVLVAQFVYLRVDREIRKKVEQTLAKAYPNLHVHVRSARLIEGEGIEIRGISIRDPGNNSAHGELVSIDELFLACNTDLKELVAGQPKITRMAVRGSTLRVVREKDGHWSTDRLFPLPKPKCEGPSPPGTIEHATIELVDLTKDPPSTYWVRDVQLTLTPGDPTPVAPGAPPSKKLAVQGSLAADFVQRIDVAGEIDLTRGAWFTSGKLSGLEACPELLAALPEPVSCKLTGCGAVRGRANIEYRVAHDPDWPERYRFEVAAEVTRGRADDPRLPFPITDLEGTVLADQTGITVRDVQAKSGDTELKIAGRWNGFSPQSPGAFRVTAKALPLDSRLRALLPGKAEEMWYQYLPAGTVNVELDLSHELGPQGNSLWHPHGVVELEGVSVSYFKFPYRLERIRGRVVLKDRLLFVEAVGQAGGQPITIKGHVQNPGPEAQIELYLAGDQIPGDERLWRALPEKPSLALRSLNPGGTFKVDARFRREAGLGQALEQYIHLTVQDGSVNFKHFAYPISGIRGTIIGHGRSWSPAEQKTPEWRWQFSDLVGVNSGGEIQCHGVFGPTERGNELQLHLTGRNVPVDEELRGALKPREQKLWDQIRPSGFVNLSSTVRFIAGAPPEVTVDVFPLDASIEPTYFPYRMEKLAGTIQFEKGRVRLSGLRARHGAVSLTARGECETTPEGNWLFKLTDFSAERLRPDRDRELFQALPAKLRTVLATLRLAGPVNVRGEIEFAGAEGVGLKSTQWNLDLQLQRCEIEPGVKLGNLYGGLSLTGRHDAKGIVCQGELDLDSVEYKDFQFTELRGPLWIDDKQVIFGSLDAMRRKESDAPTQRHLVAKVCGGTIFGDGLILLGASPEYQLQARLVDGDLGRYAREMMPGKQTHLSGRVLGTIELQGAGAHTLRGEGAIALREADIYEFPIMVSLLSILSLRPPEATAFTESDIEFKIVGDYVQFKQIDFRGDAVSLRGTGSMNMNTELQLAFHAVVGRDEIRIPVVNKVVGRAAQQLMQIQVTGTLGQPVTDRKLVPGLQAMLNELKGGPPKTVGLSRPLPPPGQPAPAPAPR